MRPLLLTLLLAAGFPLFGIWVNYTAPHPPTPRYDATRCTRYCTAHGCRHATATNSPLYWRLRPVYGRTIRVLSAAGRRWYVLVNIGVYLGLVPVLLLGLTYGALRDGAEIRRLRAARPR